MTTLLLLALLFAPAAPAQPAGGELLTLADAKRLALENNLDIQIAQERLAKASILSSKAWALLLPTLSASASVTRFDKKIEIPFGLPPELEPIFEGMGAPFPEPQNIVIQELYTKNASANFAWSLVNGRSIPLIKNAYASVEVAQLSYKQAEIAMQYATALAYYNVLNAGQQVAIRKRALAVAREHLRLSRAKVEIGEATQVVALRSEVEVATAEQLLLQAEHVERIAKRALVTLIGQVAADGTFAPFTVVHPEEQPPASDQADLLTAAYADRLDLRVGELQLEMAKRSKIESWMKFLPQLAGTGTYRWSDVKGFTGENTNWQLGLTLSWSLFEGGLTYWELQERSHDINAAALAIEKTRLDIGQQVHEARLNLETARSNQVAAKRRVELASKSAELVRAQFEVGAATQLDVIDVNRALADAETADAVAQLSVDLARLSLENVLLIPPAGSVATAGANGDVPADSTLLTGGSAPAGATDATGGAGMQ